MGARSRYVFTGVPGFTECCEIVIIVGLIALYNRGFCSNFTLISSRGILFGSVAEGAGFEYDFTVTEGFTECRKMEGLFAFCGCAFCADVTPIRSSETTWFSIAEGQLRYDSAMVEDFAGCCEISMVAGFLLLFGHIFR